MIPVWEDNTQVCQSPTDEPVENVKIINKMIYPMGEKRQIQYEHETFFKHQIYSFTILVKPILK